MKKTITFMMGLMMVAIIACSGKLTADNLEAIQTGMEKAKVIEILGQPSSEETSSTFGMSGTTMIYKKGGAEVKIILLNNKVISKSGSFK